MGASSSAMHAQSRSNGGGSQMTMSANGLQVQPANEDKSQNGKGESMQPASSTHAEEENSKDRNSAPDIHKMNFDEVLGKLNIPEHDLKSAKNIMKKNKDLHDQLLHGVKAAVSMDNGNLEDMNVYLEQMNYDFFKVPVEKRSIVGDFLKLVTFPLSSFQRYKQIIKDLGQKTLCESIISDNTVSQIIWLMRGHWWNYSDCHRAFASSLVTHGIVQEMVRDVENLIGVDEKKIKISYTFESAIGVLHNVAQNESHRQIFRELKLVDILGNFLKYENAPKITMLVLLTLALIIDESQTDLLFSHESSFDLLIQLANRAWKAKDHRYDGFSVGELVIGLKGLSKNDKVKRLLVDKNILELVSNLLVNGDMELKEIAAKLLWELSFDAVNKTLILTNEEIMKALKAVSKDSGTISRTAQGVLWVLEMASKKGESEKKKKSPAEKDVPGISPAAKGHIMISYNWDDQKQLVQIKETLKQQGFHVWMDIDNISGSTLQAMAEAVEGSSVVLVCMSERYKESNNCRSEAEYAFSLNKPIVPLLMQERYKPDGWLGILLGTKLFFDFSGRFSFDAKLSELEKELQGRGISTKGSGDVTDGPIVKESAPLVGKAPSAPKSQNMTNVEVKAWVLKNKLEKFPLFNSMEASHLSFLKKLSIKAPEFYYSFLLDLKSEKKTMEDLKYLMQVTGAIGELPF